MTRNLKHSNITLFKHPTLSLMSEENGHCVNSVYYQDSKFASRLKVIVLSLCRMSKGREPEAAVLLYRLGLIQRHRVDYFCFDYESTDTLSCRRIFFKTCFY